MIREECRLGERRLSGVEAPETEDDVVVQAVLCLMNENEEFDDRAAVLLWVNSDRFNCMLGFHSQRDPCLYQHLQSEDGTPDSDLSRLRNPC